MSSIFQFSCVNQLPQYAFDAYRRSHSAKAFIYFDVATMDNYFGLLQTISLKESSSLKLFPFVSLIYFVRPEYLVKLNLRPKNSQR